MKTNASSIHQSLKRLFLISMLLLCATGCGVTHQRLPASETQIAAAKVEIRTTRTVNKQAVSMTEARTRRSSVLARILPTARQQCLTLGERSSTKCNNWIVSVADLDEVNAGAGGKQNIIINRGIFELAKTDDELAFVMAHEMGHHMLNHVMETNVSGFIGNVFGAIAGGVIAYGTASILGVQCDPMYQDCSYIEEFVSEVVGIGSEAGKYIATMTFSRAQENEADLIAAQIVDSAGYNLRNTRNFMVQMAKASPASYANSSFGNTHPSGPERLAQFDLSMSEIIGPSGFIKDCISGDCFNGQGTRTWPDGQKYVGEFKDYKRHGQGTNTFAKGNKYVGEYKDNLFHGQGTYAYANGDQYIGEWRNGLRLGQGTYTWADGANDTIVGGCISGDCFNGQGAYTWIDGRKYVGEYKDNLFHGQGTFTWPDGRKYVGEYKDNKKHGQGTFTAADGSVHLWLWTNGEFLGSQGSAPLNEASASATDNPEIILISSLGIGVRAANTPPADTYEYHEWNEQGVIVASVNPNGFGEELGLRRGDRIMSIHKSGKWIGIWNGDFLRIKDPKSFSQWMNAEGAKNINIVWVERKEAGGEVKSGYVGSCLFGCKLVSIK
jgi:Zn-dependent protease with chaperone function